jgi:hypothetical protein
MVAAVAVIAAACFSIPVAAMNHVRRRPEAATSAPAWLFSAFIFACGITHVMDIGTIWQPGDGLQALAKGANAGILLMTAMALWPPIPEALTIPPLQQLHIHSSRAAL